MPSVARGCKGTLRPREKHARPLQPCSLRAPYFFCRRPLPPGLRFWGCPCHPCGPLPAALPPLPCGGWWRLGLLGFCFFFGGVYGWFCFCCWFFSRCRRSGPSFVLRLGMGSPRLARRCRLVSGSGLSVRAVQLVRAGFSFRAVGVGAGLALLGAARLQRLARVRGLRSAGSGFRGQGGIARRLVSRCGSHGLACAAVAFFSGGARCLGCTA